MKRGAYDYISKPFKPDEILLALRKAEERETLRKENANLRQVVCRDYSFGNMIGKSPMMLQVFETIKRISDYKASVLILGESGTGKELVARSLHFNSSRANGPFVAVSCGAIPETSWRVNSSAQQLHLGEGCFPYLIQEKGSAPWAISKLTPLFLPGIG